MRHAVLVLDRNGRFLETEPFVQLGTLIVPCPCGGLVHPIPGAWCVRCRAAVVEIRDVEKPHGS